MIYWVCLIQIWVYLFFAPLIMAAMDNSRDYFFGASTVFLLFYILGGKLINRNHNKLMPEKIIFRKIALPLLCVFSISYSYISIKHGLYNRRIGTEVIAELFAAIPFYEIIVFRIYEVILPFVLALVYVSYIYNGSDLGARRAKIGVVFSAFFVLIAVMFSGVLHSRSQLGFLLFSTLAIIQNAIPLFVFKKYLKKAALIGLLFIFGVTLSRLVSADGEFSGEYFIAEFIGRLDGLEIVSKLYLDYDISWTGISFSVLFFPIVAALPFLPQAIDLKAQALTTVKANILFLDYGSSQRDINSFVILDVYYTTGILGLALAGFAIGFAAKWVDRNIMNSAGMVKLAFAAAVACNLIFLEREFVSHVLGIFRDWFLFYIFGIVFIRKIRFHDR